MNQYSESKINCTCDSKGKRSNEPIDGHTNKCCSLLPWDTSHFNIPIAKLNINRNLSVKQLSQALEWCKNSQIKCIYALIDPYCRPIMQMLTQFRFELIDIRVTLVKKVQKQIRTNSTVSHIKKADSSYSLILKKLAYNIKWISRFTLDNRFNQPSVLSMYSEWIISRLDSVNSAVFIATENEIGTGVLVCDVNEEMGFISLIGVADNHTGKGIGKDLLSYGISWLSEIHKVKKIKVVTQACNYPALSLYEGMGFRTSKNQVWLHRWEVSDEDE